LQSHCAHFVVQSFRAVPPNNRLERGGMNKAPLQIPRRRAGAGPDAVRAADRQQAGVGSVASLSVLQGRWQTMNWRQILDIDS
jgi:hypothetical protein